MNTPLVIAVCFTLLTGNAIWSAAGYSASSAIRTRQLRLEQPLQRTDRMYSNLFLVVSMWLKPATDTINLEHRSDDHLYLVSLQQLQSSHGHWRQINKLSCQCTTAFAAAALSSWAEMSHLQTSVAAVYPRTQPMAPLKEGNHILLPANAAVVMRLIASVCVYIYWIFISAC